MGFANLPFTAPVKRGVFPIPSCHDDLALVAALEDLRLEIWLKMRFNSDSWCCSFNLKTTGCCIQIYDHAASWMVPRNVLRPEMAPKML